MLHLLTISNTLLLPKLRSVSLLANHLLQLKHRNPLGCDWEQFSIELEHCIERCWSTYLQMNGNCFDRTELSFCFPSCSGCWNRWLVLYRSGYVQNMDRISLTWHLNDCQSASIGRHPRRTTTTATANMAKHLSNWRTKCDYSNYSR